MRERKSMKHFLGWGKVILSALREKHTLLDKEGNFLDQIFTQYVFDALWTPFQR